jgi:excisionase family DNA binding protein
MSLVSKKEIMELLNISKGKLDYMIKNDEIDYIRMGRVIRFDEEKVLESIKK